jgi:hypothetical protein
MYEAKKEGRNRVVCFAGREKDQGKSESPPAEQEA